MNDSPHRDADNDGPEDDESPGPAVEQQPDRRRIDWHRIGELMSAMRDAIVNTALVCFFLALIGIVILQLTQKLVVIEPIRMPSPLTEVGFTEDVAAQRLTDAIAQIKAAAPTTKQGVAWMPASQRVDIEAPETGISLQNVVQILREALKLPETRISGEFICATPDCAQEGLTLRLRVNRRAGMKVIEMPPLGGGQIDGYYRSAALELLRELDPYLVAAYLYAENPAAAEREALRILGPEDPQRKWAMNLLGYIATDRKDYDAAIDWFGRAAAADSDDRFAIAYTNWGNALLAQDKPDDAIAKQERAIAIDPNYAFAYLSLAEALAAKGMHKQAMAEIEQAAATDPPSAYAFNVWGNVLYKRYRTDGKAEDLAAAIEKFRQATEIDPSDALAYFNWGRALDDKGRPREAIRKYTRAVELEPDHIAANVNLGIDLRKEGFADEAIARFRHVVEIDPANASALYNLGRALADTDQPQEAIGLFDRAAVLNPGDADVYLHWGMALAKTTQIPEALKKIRHAVELDPGNSMAHLSLGVMLRMLNQKADAADALQRYLDLAPAASNADQIRAMVARLRAESSGG